MTKLEFLQQLSDLLKKGRVEDPEEIVAEYERHFAYKIADGYSEQEIAAKLGAPESIAAQYDASVTAPTEKSPLLLKIGLGFADVFAAACFALLAACGLVIAGLSLTTAALGVFLLGGVDPFGVIPPLPYWCGAVMGVSALALAVLTAAGAVYYFAFLRQMARSFVRFQQNTLAAASGRPVRPGLPVHAQLPAPMRRRMRAVALTSLTVFAMCFVLGYLASALSARSLQFWHTWGWFGYDGPLVR